MYLPAKDSDMPLSALEPRRGVTQDFVNPPNLDGQILASIFVLAAFPVLLDLLRTYWKMWWRRKETWSCLATAISEGDLWLLCLGVLPSIPSSHPGVSRCSLRVDELTSTSQVLFCVSVYELYKFSQSPGYGVHTWDLQTSELVRSLEFQILYECFALAILACIKIAIHLEDWQALTNGTSFGKLIWRANVTLVLILSISTLVAIVLIKTKQHRGISETQTSPRSLFSIPQRFIWQLQLCWKDKLRPALAFGSGVIPCGVGFVSLILAVIYSGRADSVWYIRRLELLKNAEIAGWFVIRAAKCIPQIIRGHESLGGQKSPTDVPRHSTNNEFGLEGGLAGAGSKEVLWDPSLSKS
ncbi:uncharacterized protein FFNC_15384 [Fusarium fujikuroi]|nr:uncharacterized protein FFNC_15384 [Fusarium fujikuroi]